MGLSIRGLLATFLAGLALASCQSPTSPGRLGDATPARGEGLYAFASAAQLESFAKRLAAVDEDEWEEYEDASYEASDIDGIASIVSAPPPPPPPSPGSVAVSSLPAAEVAQSAPNLPEQITNTQEVGVDEGAIVKDAGDYLVILRRGRIFTVRHGGNALQPADAIDAFPPGAAHPGGAWYDEMLVHGDQVIVIGYSYDDYGTEINRFGLGSDGSLTYRDTTYLRSDDYYSSSNYASRLIGDELIFYAPMEIYWDEWRTAMPAMRRGGPGGEEIDLTDPRRVYVTDQVRRGKNLAGVAHTLTRCDVSAPKLDCEATVVLGSGSRVFYVSPSAVYLWTSALAYGGKTEQGQLFRLPLDGSRPGSVPVSGAPIDQFSFSEDRGDRVLRVLLRAQGQGDAMWGSDFSAGDVGLLTTPLNAFTDGTRELPRRAVRELPPVEGWNFNNRFIGDYVLYSASDDGALEEASFLYAAPVDGRRAQRIDLAHGVTRFDVMGADAVAIGPAPGGALGFSAISLGSLARVEDVYLLPAASEGEERSQAFFYRPDPGSPDGVSGTLGLPVSRAGRRDGDTLLGSSVAIAFLRREDRRFSLAGELASRVGDAANDACIASCVDWYGNARPIFLGQRVFALMGYELVEGRLADGRIAELRRADFTPGANARAQRGD